MEQQSLARRRRTRRPLDLQHQRHLNWTPPRCNLMRLTFVDDDGDCVPQIPLTQVVADGRGLGK